MRKHGARATALVEFALVLPIIIMILCAVIHFGILFYIQIGLEEGLREAAYYAAYTPTDDAFIRAVINGALPSLLDRQDLVVTINPPAPRGFGQPVTVQVYYPIQLLANLPFGAIISVPTSISAQIIVPTVLAP